MKNTAQWAMVAILLVVVCLQVYTVFHPVVPVIHTPLVAPPAAHPVKHVDVSSHDEKLSAPVPKKKRTADQKKRRATRRTKKTIPVVSVTGATPDDFSKAARAYRNAMIGHYSSWATYLSGKQGDSIKRSDIEQTLAPIEKAWKYAQALQIDNSFYIDGTMKDRTALSKSYAAAVKSFADP